jgi:hypothetical protein
MVRNQQPTKEGVECLLPKSRKLAVGAIRADQSDRSTIPVRPVACPQIGSGYSLKKTLLEGKFGLGPKHVQKWA